MTKRVHTEESLDQLSSLECDAIGISEIEELRSDLTDKNNKIKRWEVKVKRQFEKLKADSMRIEQENEELKKRKIALNRREESVRHERGLLRT